MSFENSARLEIQSAGQLPRPYHPKQQETYRGRQKIAEIDPPALARFGILMMCHQWICRKRQNLIRDKQSQHISGKGYSKRTTDREGKTNEKSCLVIFILASHIADGIDRAHYPQERRNKSEHHAKRL